MQKGSFRPDGVVVAPILDGRAGSRQRLEGNHRLRRRRLGGLSLSFLCGCTVGAAADAKSVRINERPIAAACPLVWMPRRSGGRGSGLPQFYFRNNDFIVCICKGLKIAAQGLRFRISAGCRSSSVLAI